MDDQVKRQQILRSEETALEEIFRKQKDAKAKALKRTNQSIEDYEIGLIINAATQFDKRAGETEGEHQTRLLEQKTRQSKLRANETSEEHEFRKKTDNKRKTLRREAGPAAYEDTVDA